MIHMTPGHVYILLNAAMPGLLKIGKTTRTPEERAEELSRSSGVAAPFSVAYAEDVPDCDGAEEMIHNRLEKFRENKGREFFRLPTRDAIEALRQIARELRQRAAKEFEARALKEKEGKKADLQKGKREEWWWLPDPWGMYQKPREKITFLVIGILFYACLACLGSCIYFFKAADKAAPEEKAKKLPAEVPKMKRYAEPSLLTKT
jgi:hypothetical protein